MKIKKAIKVWLLTSIIAGIIYFVIWAIPRLWHFEKDIYKLDSPSDLWEPIPILAGLLFLFLLGLPIFVRNIKKSKKLALLVGSWLFYLPILRGSLFPSLFGTLYGLPVPFASGSFVILFGLPFNFPQTESIYHWIEHGEIEPHFLASRIIIAAGVAITIVGFIQAIKVFREKRLPNDGLYATVRHPQHLGIALLTLGFAVGTGRTIGFMAWFTIFYFYILLAIWEERKQEEQFGEMYQVYRQKTPFMIPFINIGISLPAKGWKRVGALFALYVIGLSLLCLILNMVGVSIIKDTIYRL